MTRLASVLTIFALLLAGTSVAQIATGTDPGAVADEAVATWLDRAEDFDMFALASDSPAQLCSEYAFFGQDPNIVAGTIVNFDDRRLLPADVEGQRVYSYSARVGDTGLARVRVLLSEVNDSWHAEAVRLQVEGIGAQLPGFMTHDAAGFVFIAFTLYLGVLLFRPSWFRRLLGRSWQVLKQHKGIVIGTIVVLYGAYGLGSMFGAGVPECQEAVAAMVGGALGETGVVDVLQDDNVPKTAAVITYWNFLYGTIATTLFPAFLFGIPAYLINIPRYFVLGVALAPVGPNVDLLVFHLPVIVIELMAYVLVTAGGLIFLMTLVREGFAAFRTATQRLLLTRPIAFLLLVVGAWYESYEILRLIPMFTGAPPP